MGCWFRRCRWLWITNVAPAGECSAVGLWQCARCRDVSIGRAVYPKRDAKFVRDTFVTDIDRAA